MEGRPVEVFFDRGLDRQQRTKSLSSEAQNFLQPDPICIQSAEGAEREGHGAHSCYSRVAGLTLIVNRELVQATGCWVIRNLNQLVSNVGRDWKWNLNNEVEYYF